MGRGGSLAPLSHRTPASPAAHSLLAVIGWGALATAIVQVPYLGHGDAGLLNNIGVAGLFTVAGAIVTAVWALLARVATRRR